MSLRMVNPVNDQPARLRELARTGKYHNQDEVATAAGLSTPRIAQIKRQAVEAGLFTEREWKRWLNKPRRRNCECLEAD